MNKLFFLSAFFLATFFTVSFSFGEDGSQFPKGSFAEILGREVNVLYWRPSEIISSAVELADEDNILSNVIQNSSETSDLWVFVIDNWGQVKDFPEIIKEGVLDLPVDDLTAFYRIDATVNKKRKIQIKIINLEPLSNLNEDVLICRIAHSIYRDIRFYVEKASQGRFTECEGYSS